MNHFNAQPNIGNPVDGAISGPDNFVGGLTTPPWEAQEKLRASQQVQPIKNGLAIEEVLKELQMIIDDNESLVTQLAAKLDPLIDHNRAVRDPGVPSEIQASAVVRQIHNFGQRLNLQGSLIRTLIEGVSA